jgi:outer membrane protein OmpA-like peptidoglycan-associated protein
VVIIWIVLFGFPSYAQQKPFQPVYSDCLNAIEVVLSGSKKIGPTAAPLGSGDLNEISFHKNKSKFVFEKEHHSAWYLLKVQQDGKLVFDITPLKDMDDYDFVVFKKEDDDFCSLLKQNAAKPIRACISRNNKELKGKTGLSILAKKELIHEGVGDAYVKALEVRKGEQYYLVLDNVYPEGAGHIIQFAFEEMVNVAGVIKDEYDIPVVAEVSIVNAKGDTIIQSYSRNDGSFKMDVPLRKGADYTLNFFNPNRFTYSQNLKTGDSVELKRLSILLPQLKKGKKYSVGNINFYPGKTEYLPQSLPSIINLFRLMDKNPKLKIRIIGHSNGRDQLNEEQVLQFTVNRALSIKNYMVSKGIQDSRIETDGKGDHEMLFELPQATPKQQEQNRRVEVFVIEN